MEKNNTPCGFMMFSMGDAQKHSSSSTPPRRTTGRTIRVPRNRPGRHNGIPIHSCAIPTYLAAAPIAFTLDEYEALNSVSNRTAFTLNSPAHQVPFAIIPSSPIELGECGTKNQLISLFLFLELSLASPASYNRAHSSAVRESSQYAPNLPHSCRSPSVCRTPTHSKRLYF